MTVNYDDVDYNVISIADSAFFNATSTRVELHTAITHIGNYAFEGTTGLNIISPSLIKGEISGCFLTSSKI